MSAPIGNKHAERWTRERTIQYLDKIEELMNDYDFIFLGDVLAHVRLYNDIWAYWKQKWEDDYDIYDRIMLINQRFENRLLKASMFKEVHAGVAMFVLKCQYGYAVPKPAKETDQGQTAPHVHAYDKQAPAEEPIKEKDAASLPSEPAETPTIQAVESVKDTFAAIDISHHGDVVMADTGS